MKQPYYPFHSADGRTFYFTSEGNHTIHKVVEFLAIGSALYNLGFGDILMDGSYDDMAVSDNGDMRKVIATIVQITLSFSKTHPSVKIVFTGSSVERIRLYNRILRNYHLDFSNYFTIMVAYENGESMVEDFYRPDMLLDHVYFFITHKN